MYYTSCSEYIFIRKITMNQIDETLLTVQFKFDLK